jgi:hypothetical protein
VEELSLHTLYLRGTSDWKLLALTHLKKSVAGETVPQYSAKGQFITALHAFVGGFRCLCKKISNSLFNRRFIYFMNICKLLPPNF